MDNPHFVIPNPMMAPALEGVLRRINEKLLPVGGIPFVSFCVNDKPVDYTMIEVVCKNSDVEINIITEEEK